MTEQGEINDGHLGTLSYKGKGDKDCPRVHVGSDSSWKCHLKQKYINGDVSFTWIVEL